jgi:ribosomal protein S18 acetylase RimI-like enzyme
MKEICRSLQFKPVRRRDDLFFNFLEFRFFSHSERGSILFFGSTRVLHAFVIVPYILAAEIIFFRGWRYFVKLEEQVAGILAVRERTETLFVNSLAVSPEYRRFGVAMCILDYSEKLAKRLGKEQLELSVLKLNIPARKLYWKFGFTREEERRWSFVLSKKV